MALDSALTQTRRVGLPAYAAGGLAVALVIVVLGNVNVSAGENGGTGPGIFTGVACTLVTIGLFAGLLPRLRQGTERAAVVLGALAVVSLAAFWSGLPPVLAAAAAAALARTEAPGRAARSLTVVGVVAAALSLGWTIATSHLF